MRVWKGALALALVVPFGAVAALSAQGCSGDSNTSGSTSSSQGGGGPGGAGGATATAGSGGDINIGGNQNTGGAFDQDAACVATSAEATLVKKPVDILFIIDNSGSMGDNIQSVQDNINANFAAIIGASGIDYQVIMISAHGAIGSESICVQAPLSSTDCNPVPAEPGQNPPIFHQYSIEIGSHNSWCQALKSYDGTLADQFGAAPGGWKTWLRKDAVKVFVEITDDLASCSFNGVTYDDNDSLAGGTAAADLFETALFTMDPEQFGDAQKPNYVWHSIIGLEENMPPTKEYVPADPVVTTTCSTAVNSGTGYQVLSQKTGGLRFPICEFASYDVVFQAIAKGVIAGAKVACEFPVPDPPQGETIDLTTVVVQYTPGAGGDPQLFKQVANAAACMPGSFYIENNVIKLCTDACAAVQNDDKAKIGILYGCKQDIQ